MHLVVNFVPSPIVVSQSLLYQCVQGAYPTLSLITTLPEIDHSPLDVFYNTSAPKTVPAWIITLSPIMVWS
jgi:hypothetical protein